MADLPPEADSVVADPAIPDNLSGLGLQTSAFGLPPDLAEGMSEGLIPFPNIEFDVDWGDLPTKGELRLKLDSNEEQDLKNDIISAVIAADDARRERMETVKKVRSRYYLTTPDRIPLFPEGANYHVPFTRWTLDAVRARLYEQLFGSGGHIVLAKGILGQSDADRAARIEPFVEFMNRHELKLPDIFDGVIERTLTDGDVYLKIPWRRHVRNVRRRRLESIEQLVTDGEGGAPLLDEMNAPTIRIIQRYVIEEQPEVLYHGPTAELVTIDNFIQPNPNEHDLNRQPWVGQQFWMTRGLLWAEREREVVIDGVESTEGQYRNVNKVLGFTRREDTEIHGMAQQANTAAGSSGTQIASGEDLVGEVRCIEVIWPYRDWKIAKALRAGQVEDDLRDDTVEGWPERVIVTIAADAKVLLRADIYPFWDSYPEHYFVRVSAIFREGRANSQAFGEIIMPVQDELDTLHWMRTDAGTVMIMAFFTFLAEEGSADDLNRIVLGAKNKVNSLQGVKLFSDVIKIAIQVPGLDIESLVLKFGELLSGVGEPMLGVPATGSKTAYEIGSVERGGSVKFSHMMTNLGRAIIACDQIGLRRYAQFYPLVEPKIFRVLGEEGDVLRELALEDLNFTYDFELRGVTLAVNREVEAAKAFRLLQLSQENSWFRTLLLAHPDGIYEVVSGILRQIEIPGGPEAIIGKKKEVMETLKVIVQNELVMQMLLGGGMMGGGESKSAGPTNPRAAVAQLLNDSGMGNEMARQGRQPTDGARSGG